jgi:hypothetical protein
VDSGEVTGSLPIIPLASDLAALGFTIEAPIPSRLYLIKSRFVIFLPIDQRFNSCQTSGL